jgi:hypothetical protein
MAIAALNMRDMRVAAEPAGEMPIVRKTAACTGATPHLVRCANFTGQLWTLMSTLDACDGTCSSSLHVPAALAEFNFSIMIFSFAAKLRP